MPQPSAPAEGIRAISAITLRTGDMAACVAFYRALGTLITSFPFTTIFLGN